MHKFTWGLSTFVVTAMAISGLSTQFMPTTKAQTSPSRSAENVVRDFSKQQRDNPPPGGEWGGGIARASWDDIFQGFFNNNEDRQTPSGGKKPGSGISRGGGVCAIAPLGMTANAQVWSDRPLFVWRGQLSRLEVRPVGSNRVLWRQSGTQRLNRVRYTGEQLQPGQTYEWNLFDLSVRDSSSPKATLKFRVMDAQKRDRIKSELQALERELRGASDEEIAMQRAQYFARQQLWTDVLQEAYSVENPSPALTKLFGDINKEICINASGQNSVQSR